MRDAATVEPTEALEAKGKSAPLEAYRLVEVSAGLPGHARRLDSPMIGRQRQRRLLAEAYDQVVGERVCHLFTLLGAAGVGKSRLVNEFLGGLGDEALELHGRCLSYGEGITYWPIAEVVREAAGLSEADDEAAVRSKIGVLVDDDRDRGQVVERIGELIGRFGGGAAPEETSWAVRRLFESLAAQRPLVLVLDDLQWAEPTLLDLVEYLADWIRDAPVLLVCLARQELLEARPGWGGGKLSATTLTLEPLNDAESHELVANLLGRVALAAPLEEKIAAAAEGNPLFVEEMIGMLIDSGELVRQNGGWKAISDLAQLAVPPTIQALLAARLDGLPTPERAVIERAAVEGKVFHQGAVAELAPDALRETVPLHLRSLARKELVRPDRATFPGDEAFRFRHLLIRDAAYGAMSKENRADLHARFASWLTRVAGDHVTEYEEILGYHYEQAHRYRVELGAPDDEARRLAAAAAEHLGASGQRALDRGDVQAAIKLLSRATDLLPADDPARTRLLAELGSALAQTGELRRADSLLAEAIERASSVGDELGRAYAEAVRLITLTALGQVTIEEVIRRSQNLLATFEEHGDERGAERATIELAGHHFFAGRARLSEQIVTTRIARYPPGEAPLALIEWAAPPLFWGPTAVDEAIAAIAKLLGDTPNRVAETQRLRYLGALRGLVGDFEEGRRMLHRSIAIDEELGRRAHALATAGHLLGPFELLAEDQAEAERVLVDAYEGMSATGDLGFSSTVACSLAESYVELGRFDEAEQYARIARETSSPDDIEAQSHGRSVGARVLAARGELEAAERMAREAVEIAEQTDYLTLRGTTLSDLAEVLLAAGRREEATGALRRALGNFEAKGATVLANRTRRRLEEITAG